MTLTLRTPQLVIAGGLALLLLGGGFAAGTTIGKSGGGAAASASPSGAAARFGQGGAGVRGQGGGANIGGQQVLSGRVISVNDGSITVEVRQPGTQGASPTVTSEIVLVGSSTRVVKTAETEIKLTDLKANDQIQIVGTTDATGSTSATAIVVGGNALQQVFGGQGGPGGRGASPSPSPTR